MGTVHEVLGDFESVVATERARSGLHRVGDAHQGADGFDGTVTVDDQGDQRAAGDELDELPEEGALAVLAVMLLGGVTIEGAQLDGAEGETLPLDPADHLSHEAPTNAVGLDEDEG